MDMLVYSSLNHIIAAYNKAKYKSDFALSCVEKTENYMLICIVRYAQQPRRLLHPQSQGPGLVRDVPVSSHSQSYQYD